MPQLLKDQYEKLGATFATAEEALTDKNSMFTPDLLETANYEQLAELGIYLQPPYPEWDPESFTLSVCKLVSSEAEYDANRTFNKTESVQEAELAGWTWLGRIVQEVV